MELNLKERLMLLNIMPKHGDITTIRIIQDLQRSFAPTEEEFAEFEIKQEGNHYSWGDKGNKPKEIKIGAKGLDIIRGELKRLDKAKQLTADHVDIYKKFMEDE